MMPSLLKKFRERNEGSYVLPQVGQHQYLRGNVGPPGKPRVSWTKTSTAAAGSRTEVFKSSDKVKPFHPSRKVIIQHRLTRDTSTTGAGDQTRVELQDHTSWANRILSQRNQSKLVDDLQRALADGITLVNLLETLTQETVAGVERHPFTQTQKTNNTRRCLKFLENREVDIDNIKATDLTNGHLNSVAHLFGNIRKQFDAHYQGRIDGDGRSTKPRLNSRPSSSEWLDMPATTQTGSTRPPPGGRNGLQAGRDSPRLPQTFMHGSQDILPGSMGREDAGTRTSYPQPNMSRTELGTDDAIQYKLQDHMIPSTSGISSSIGRFSQLTRPRTTDAISRLNDRLPATVNNAWSNSRQATPVPPAPALSVEDRLKSVLNIQEDKKNNQMSQSSETKTVYRIYDYQDGELLVPPPPRPREDTTYGDSNAYGEPSRSHYSQVRRGLGVTSYVPSHPSDRIGNSRAEAPMPKLRYNNQSRVTSSAAPSTGQYDNYGYTKDEGSKNAKATDDRPSRPPSSQSQLTQNSVDRRNDMRSAWNKLYNPHGDPRTVSTSAGQPPDNNSYPAFHHQVASKYGAANHLLTNTRASPMGQSSSTQGQKTESNSSNLSGSSGLARSQDAEPVSPSHSVALEPDSHYPDASNNYTGYSSFKPELDEKNNLASYESKQNKNIHEATFELTANDKVPSFDNLSLQARGTEMSSTPNKPVPTKRKTKTVTTLPTSGAFPTSHTNPAFVDSDMDSDSTPNLEESMFDYNDSLSMASSRSITPPLPPLSPTNSQRSSSENSSAEITRFPRSLSATGLSIPKTPDLLTSTTRPHSGGKRGVTKRETSSQINMKISSKKSSKHNSRSRTTGRKFSPRADSLHPGNHLGHLSESDNEDILSFDIDNTFLTLDSHESSPNGVQEVLTSKESQLIRGQLDGLEKMYQDIMQLLGVDRNFSASGRRWSIASSDTSSFKRGRTLRSSASRRHGTDVKSSFRSVNKRFERLESNLVSLARKVARLSSDIRSKSVSAHELESLRREIRELRDRPQMRTHENPSNAVSDFERFRGWVPSLTNPRRVNKLTKFFGQEPPLLQLFLKKLGYEKYASNFATEHIGMIELPYMNEERLKSIGIPMGPRLRILQEAQMCFRQENFNIYIV